MLSPAVHVRREPVVLPTYSPLPPDKNPMFLENRVYQGSSGKVYPLPFYDRVSETKAERAWDAVYLENQFVKLMILPEIGGRIHVGQDKTNGYNFFYRQSTIKPALVGLAGPWISGGVEFNWPQHHRPATFMPVDVHVEDHRDGSKTVWLSDHDPMERMKGMHGICLHPETAVVEVKMRAYNRTPFVQTFLWWANVATHVNEGYQSVFPPDVTAVADHAKRAMSRFPLCHGRYYGVDYGRRVAGGLPPDEQPPEFVPPHSRPVGAPSNLPVYAPNDLSWYANIPVPTSYMCIGSKKDFSGGYDHLKQAGLIQVSNHHISPGKKQWTWGNHPFGYAWDRNLTDGDGPYVELMTGVYTDNQPDFSFLQPGETKTWSVFWYPVQRIGASDTANLHAAAALRLGKGQVEVAVAVTQSFPGAVAELWNGPRKVAQWVRDLAPDKPLLETVSLRDKTERSRLSLSVCSAEGKKLLSYRPEPRKEPDLPSAASEPPLPEKIKSADELYLVGLHLCQYRHATRSPLPYWQEALRRDPGDARCNHAVGLFHLRRGEFNRAEDFHRRAIDRLTSRNPNPYDGEPYYHLGLTFRFLGREEEAYAAFYKAAWNQAWQSASYHALAELDCKLGEWTRALEHVDHSLRLDQDHLRARDLRVLILRRLGRDAEAQAALTETLALDPLDWWARSLNGDTLACDTQLRLDLALDFSRAGFYKEAIALLENARPEAGSGTAPLIHYYLAHFHDKIGQKRDAQREARAAAEAAPDYCFPARLDEILILEAALLRNDQDARAAYYLGNLLYDKRRHLEALRLWEKSARLDPSFSIVWRNLGLAYFNASRSPALAQRAYERAFRANPRDPRLLYERDQLWKRLGKAPKKRLREFEKNRALVDQRDDATAELCALYNLTGRSRESWKILTTRHFQPWEGGEGQVLSQYAQTCLSLGREALALNKVPEAVSRLEAGLHPPATLGEAKHLLANQSDLHFWLGEAKSAQGDTEGAHRYWSLAAKARGDFQEMSVRPFSEMSFFSGQALARLGRRREAQRLFRKLRTYAQKLARTPATIDYFATSLPTMLLFNDDLQARQERTSLLLQAQAALGLGEKTLAQKHLKAILAEDPGHALASQFLEYSRSGL